MLQRLAVAAILVIAITDPIWAGPVEDEALRDAAFKLNIEGVRAALAKGANVNAPTATVKKSTALEGAAVGMAGTKDKAARQRAAVEITKILFAAGAKLGPYDRDILLVPIMYGNTELVRILLDRGASAKGDLKGYTTPTLLARKYGQDAIYDLLVSRGVPVNARTSAQLDLVQAAAEGNIAAMERAIANGASINDQDAEKETALISAVRYISLDPRVAGAVRWLLDHGADANRMGDGDLPLHVFILMSKHALVSEKPEVRLMSEDVFSRCSKPEPRYLVRMSSAALPFTSPQSTTTSELPKSSSKRAPR